MNWIELNCKVTTIHNADFLNGMMIFHDAESITVEETEVKGYFQEAEVDIKPIIEQLRGLNIELESKTIVQENWNAKWEADYEPVIVNENWAIQAPFHQLEDQYPNTITINPGMAFGTGHHSTTFLMSNIVVNHPNQFEKVLDFGAGSGVLSILAEKCGASKIIAVEIDEWAVNNLKGNLKLNNTQNIEAICGSIENVESTNFDLILANINRNVLIDNADLMIEKLTKNGQLFLSGIIETDLEIIKEKFSSLNCTYQEKHTEWLCLGFKKD